MNESGQKQGRPDLRKAARNNRPRQIIGGACLLAAIYMYPSILKPMFGIGSSSSDSDPDETRKKVEEINKVLAQHRPDNMPDWSSPFAPKRGDQ